MEFHQTSCFIWCLWVKSGISQVDMRSRWIYREPTGFESVWVWNRPEKPSQSPVLRGPTNICWWKPGGGSLGPIRMIRNFRPIEKLQHLQLKDVPNVLVVSPCDETRSNAKLDLDLDFCMAWLRSSHLDQVDCYSLHSMIVDWIGWLVDDREKTNRTLKAFCFSKANSHQIQEIQSQFQKQKIQDDEGFTKLA